MRVRFTFSLVLAGLIVGCDRDNGAPPAPPAPARPAPTVAASMPATTQAAESLIWVDQQAFQFPPARIIASTRSDAMTAQLFSNDPPGAASDSYTGNSYYLELSNFELQDPASLDNAVWDYKAPDSNRAESVSGIFLQGRRWHLQPFDVHATFEGTQSPLKINLSGQFLMFDNDQPQLPGKLVAVRAEFDADLRIKAPEK